MSRCLTHPRMEIQAKEQKFANLVFFGGALCFCVGTAQMDAGLFVLGFILLLGGSLLYLKVLEESYLPQHEFESEDAV